MDTKWNKPEILPSFWTTILIYDPEIYKGFGLNKNRVVFLGYCMQDQYGSINWMSYELKYDHKEVQLNPKAWKYIELPVEWISR